MNSSVEQFLLQKVQATGAVCAFVMEISCLVLIFEAERRQPGLDRCAFDHSDRWFMLNSVNIHKKNKQFGIRNDLQLAAEQYRVKYILYITNRVIHYPVDVFSQRHTNSMKNYLNDNRTTSK